MQEDASNRRDFLRGKALQNQVRKAGDAIADSIIGHTVASAPDSRDTLRLTQRAMACDFSVIMNGGEHESIWSASAALDLLTKLEEQLSVYQPNSEVSQLNRRGYSAPQAVEPQLFRLLQLSKRLAEQTNNAFDLTTDPLIRLWSECREAVRVPRQDEVSERLCDVGMHLMTLDDANQTLSFQRSGTSINLGAIGKGYALDCMTDWLLASPEATADPKQQSEDFLLHGGQSSLIARGQHTGCDGWPVGIGNPLFPGRRLGTIVLKNQALATSGSNIQYFRVGEKRYGHILDPRTGWPVDGTLSVTAIAAEAAVADALSTAFYVMAPNQIAEYCRLHPEVGAILIPLPQGDRRVEPSLFGVDPQQIYWDSEQIRIPQS